VRVTTELKLEERLLLLAERQRKVTEKRAQADMEEAAIRTELREIAAETSGVLAPAVGGTTIVAGRASSLPPLPKGARGQGDRIVDLLRERPRASISWLCAHIYGTDSPEKRQGLASMLGYLAKKERITRVGGGQYEVASEGRAMTK